MIRGTTPTLTFTVPFDANEIKKIRVIFSQNGNKVLVFEGDRCVADGRDIKIKMTQQETLVLKQNAPVEIQVRVLMKDDTAMASKIITTSVNRILEDGEI